METANLPYDEWKMRMFRVLQNNVVLGKVPTLQWAPIHIAYLALHFRFLVVGPFISLLLFVSADQDSSFLAHNSLPALRSLSPGEGSHGTSHFSTVQLPLSFPSLSLSCPVSSLVLAACYCETDSLELG